MNVYILFSNKNVIGLAKDEAEANLMLSEYEMALGAVDAGDLSFMVCEVGEYCDQLRESCQSGNGADC